MRKRKRTRNNIDPVEKLAEIYKQFSHAYFIEGDKERALQIRNKANHILEDHPKLIDQVPARIGRNAYIDWSRFIKYPETLNMKP